MLPAVVKASGSIPVMFDSGIRSGTHVVKALAMGAAAVGVGRPYAYGLALGGTDGIVHVLRSMLAEADLLMAVDGYPTLADLKPEVCSASSDDWRALGAPGRREDLIVGPGFERVTLERRAQAERPR